VSPFYDLGKTVSIPMRRDSGWVRSRFSV